jgi:DNA polymerase-3 subunit beta
MKVSANRKAFLQAISNISGVIPSRSPRPILQNMKFSADADGDATLTATDLEASIIHRPLGVVVDQPGSAILPPKVTSIFGSAPDIDIRLATDGDTLTVRGQQSRFNLPSEDATLFPEPPAWTAESWWTVKAADLRKMIRRTITSTDETSTRYALGGVLFELADATLTLVGTDGRRLCQAVAPVESEGSPVVPSGSPVVPVKALKLIDRNLDDDEATVDLAFVGGVGANSGASAIMLRTGDGRTTIYSRLVEGRFPAYRDVYPTETPVRIPLDVASLRQVVGQAAIMTSDESRGVDLEFGADVLTLQSTAADVGSAQITMPIDHREPAVSITFDPRYLQDVLKTVDDDEEFVAELLDHKNAAVFKAGSNFSAVIMPLTRS